MTSFTIDIRTLHVVRDVLAREIDRDIWHILWCKRRSDFDYRLTLALLIQDATAERELIKATTDV